MELLSFVEKANQVQTVADLIELFARACSARGFDHFALAELRPAMDSPAERVVPIAVRYPRGWTEHYQASGYAAVDPVVLQTPLRRGPHWWTEFQIGEPQQRMIREAGEAGLRRGAAIPVHGPFGEVLIAGFATDTADLPATVLAELHFITTQFKLVHGALASQVLVPSVSLTDRELECLRWSACGKSSLDIAEILHVSENTVNFHLKNAIAKLDACNRTMAIVKAIRMGIVTP